MINFNNENHELRRNISEIEFQLADGVELTSKQQDQLGKLEDRVDNMLEEAMNSAALVTAVNDSSDAGILRIELRQLKQVFNNEVQERQALDDKIEQFKIENEKDILQRTTLLDELVRREESTDSRIEATDQLVRRIEDWLRQVEDENQKSINQTLHLDQALEELSYKVQSLFLVLQTHTQTFNYLLHLSLLSRLVFVLIDQIAKPLD